MLADLFAGAVLVVLASTVAAPAVDTQTVSVVETDGLYRVSATFTVPQQATIASAVLMDVERIPLYMPDIKSSTVLERSANGLLVEQRAIAHFMMFSKPVHLVLQVNEQAGSITFRDQHGSSFAVYEGAWILTALATGGTTIRYELAAKPTFDVPGFVLKRLLKRDAALLIDRLKAEIGAGRSERIR